MAQAEQESKEEAPAAQGNPAEHDPATLVVEDRVIPKVSFDSLIAGTLFDGFYYSNSMAVVPHGCGENGDRGECWTARAQGGQFGYGIDGRTPGYFARVKNIEEAQLLRSALRDVRIERLTVKGKGKMPGMIIIQGTSGGEPAYIELTISDLE